MNDQNRPDHPEAIVCVLVTLDRFQFDLSVLGVNLIHQIFLGDLRIKSIVLRNNLSIFDQVGIAKRSRETVVMRCWPSMTR